MFGTAHRCPWKIIASRRLRLKDAWGFPLSASLTKIIPRSKTRALACGRSTGFSTAAVQTKMDFPIDEQQFGVHLLGTCRHGQRSKTSVKTLITKPRIKNLFSAMAAASNLRPWQPTMNHPCAGLPRRRPHQALPSAATSRLVGAFRELITPRSSVGRHITCAELLDRALFLLASLDVPSRAFSTARPAIKMEFEICCLNLGQNPRGRPRYMPITSPGIRHERAIETTWPDLRTFLSKKWLGPLSVHALSPAVAHCQKTNGCIRA